jgi:DNA-binding response OmpR family regulator
VRCTIDGALALALPGMDGLQLLQALREHPALKELPVIALTGMGRPADARRAIAAGFAAHLRKPVTLSKLLATLQRGAAAAAGVNPNRDGTPGRTWALGCSTRAQSMHRARRDSPAAPCERGLQRRAGVGVALAHLEPL